MPVCPVCAEAQDADQAAFEYHVNQHFDPLVQSDPSPTVESSADSRSDHAPVVLGFSRQEKDVSPTPLHPEHEHEASSQLDTCPVCEFPLSYLTPTEAELHLNGCLEPPPNSASSSSIHDGYAQTLSRDVSSRKRGYDGDNSSATDRAPIRRSDVGSEQNSDWEMEMETERDHEPDFSVNGHSALQGRGREYSSHAHGKDEDEGWDGPAKPGGWMDWASKKVERGDKWWDPIKGSQEDVPQNFSPGVIPTLAQVFRTSAHQGTTRRAVLCRDVVHVKGIWKFDMGWGCGYRNAQMAITSLLSIKAYQPIFDMVNNGSEPGVRRIQGWIQEAWDEGYDKEGCKQLKGKILGTRKWIGPSDDFPKPKDSKDGSRTAHIALQQWVKAYFSNDDSYKSSANASNPFAEPKTAFDVMMRTTDDGAGRGEVVRVSKKFPLILQHSGHSRTIVGYEENARGDINLLLFDPGRSIPKDVRTIALSRYLEQNRQLQLSENFRQSSSHNAPTVSNSNDNSPDLGASAERPRKPSLPPLLTKRSSKSNWLEDTHESRPFSPPFTNGRSDILYPSLGLAGPSGNGNTSGAVTVGADGRNRRQSSGHSQNKSQSENQSDRVDHMRGGSEIVLEDDEEMTPSGWVRKKTPSTNHDTSSSLKSKLKSKINGSSSSTRTPSDANGNGIGGGPLDTLKTLNYFRVNLGALSRQTQYQVLAFTGGEVLSPAERERRKEIRSTVVRA
ncbi:hypothetical protein IAT40_007931 [Kwoniella sp. CBS 6097]